MSRQSPRNSLDRWKSQNIEDQIQISIPRFVARRLAVLVKFALIFMAGFHPDHAKVLLEALGETEAMTKRERCGDE